MAAAALRTSAWLAASVLAVGIIAVLGLQGRRPDPGLVRFTAAGIMGEPGPEEVTAVEVEAGGRHWRFARAAPGGWRRTPDSERPGTRFADHLDQGLRLLHVSAPLRRLSPEEVGGTPLSEFGLDPPRYVVAVRAGDGPVMRFAFGATNPQGLGQYVRIAGREGVAILPRFVGESWEAAAPVP